MKLLKVGGVIFGAIILTALGIDAADTLQGSRSTLLGQLVATEDGGCPKGMTAVPAAPSFSCVDVYEASPDNACPSLGPANEFDTERNMESQACKAVSEAEVEPWRFITREQAQVACVRAGKRLPSNEEWQLVAAGTPDTDSSCNTKGSGASQTGVHTTCQSAAGVFDAIGNVWEWTNEDVFDGTFNGRTLPEEGYVLQVDRGGIATLTGTDSSDLFNEDYFWSESSGTYGVLRGGFYGSREDAGVYAAHAATLPTMTSAAIGFRCVQ